MEENASEESQAEKWDVSDAGRWWMEDIQDIYSFCERWLQCQITDGALLITKHTGLD